MSNGTATTTSNQPHYYSRSLLLDAIFFASFVHPTLRNKTWDQAARTHSFQAVFTSRSILGHCAPRFPPHLSASSTRIDENHLPMKMFVVFENFVPFQFHFATQLHLRWDGTEMPPIDDEEKNYVEDRSKDPHEKSRFFFLRRFFQIKSFHITCERDEMNTFRKLESHELDFVGCGSKFFVNWPELEELNMVYTLGYPHTAYRPVIIENFEASKSLRTLKLDAWACRAYGGDQSSSSASEKNEVSDLFRSFPQSLRSLTLFSSYWTNQDVEEAFALLPECLEELNLNSVFGSLDTEEDADILNRTFAPEKTPFLHKNLKKMDFSYNDYIPPQSAKFFKHFQALEELNLRECGMMISPDFFRQTLSHLHRTLRVLKLDYNNSINDECLEIICDTLPNLQVLTFHSCHNAFTHEGGIRHLEKLSKTLRVLNLDAVYLDKPESFKTIGALSELRTLGLRGSAGLNAETIKFIGENENIAKNLSWFNIEQCGQMNDEAVIYIAKTFTNLVTLHLSSLDKVSGKSFKAIFDHLKKLKFMRAIGTGSGPEPQAFEFLKCRGLIHLNGNLEDGDEEYQ